MNASPAVAAALLAFASAVSAQGFADGPKLVGTGGVGTSRVGTSAALSFDGTTAILGAPLDASTLGAAFVFTRSAGGAWRQQGAKLVGTGSPGTASQGSAVALSDDGSTALVGGSSDNAIGAAWVFTRTGSTWTQQGSKLVGSGNVGFAQEGISVALSGDGNTAIVGGWTDDTNVGAAWVFTRTAAVWTQQGAKLVGTGTVGGAQQGRSVDLSTDGNTAVVGGPTDDANAGAAWVFTRTAGVWSQQGAKLFGTGVVEGGKSQQGGSVAISGDGNTVMLGGAADFAAGASWIFTRSAGVWSQQGGKLVGTGAAGGAQQGWAVALSADGNTAIATGAKDGSSFGATWAFKRNAGVWTQLGDKLLGPGANGSPQQGTSVALSRSGRRILAGGPFDSSLAGAGWIFERPCAAGDSNGDGTTNVNDVFFLINFLFAGGAAPSCS
jgi:hypothetical protein